MSFLRLNYLVKHLTEKTKEVKNLRKIIVRHNHYNQDSVLLYGEDVAFAKKNRLPIVALESTIITHGMPYPDNLTTALEVEDIIRKKGVVPATIAILDGKIVVGASKTEIEKLAKNEDNNIIKVSRRDFSYAISQGLTGGTTVSGTMLVSKLAGIPIMATGGIGGVHRQVELSMDISADLKELGQTPVAVVCSGVKAILDIPKTLEYLESQGVPLATIGPTDEFPAFYSRRTLDRLRAPARLENAKEAARLISVQRHLELGTGILLAVPIPESHSLDPLEIEEAIKKALESAELKNIRGKSVTPFLLGELSRLTAGRSLDSNKALIKNNARVAAEVALHLADLESNVSMLAGSRSDASKVKKNPVVIGGATFDTILRVKEPEINFNGSTHKGESHRSCGGVGRNLAEAMLNLGMTDTKLLSVVGDDEAGRAVVQSLGAAASNIRILPNISTARYTAILNNEGNCCFGVGEMEAFTKIDAQLLEQNMEIFKDIPLLVLDGNPTLDAMKFALDIAIQNKIPVWYEPTDLNKVLKVFQCGSQWKNVLSFISPNVNELIEMAKYFQIPVPPFKSEIDLEVIKEISISLTEQVPIIIATLGARGILVTRKSSENEPFLNSYKNVIETNNVQSRLYSPLNFDKKIASVSGCGDCLAAGIITGIIRGLKESSCMSLGLQAAKESLTVFETVPNSLKSLSKVHEFIIKSCFYSKL